MYIKTQNKQIEEGRRQEAGGRGLLCFVPCGKLAQQMGIQNQP
jgi:hypothetical protein